MTTIENPATEKMNGSSRITSATDSPWWIVRPSLAAGLAGSFAITAGAFRFAGLPDSGAAFSARSLPGLMQALSATPTLIAFAVFAFAVLLRRNSGRSLRVLCLLLALASLAGAVINAARDAHGRGPVETWVEKTLASMSPSFVGK